MANIITDSEMREQARQYINRIDGYYLEEQALKAQLDLLQRRMGPAGLSGSSLGDGIHSDSRPGLVEQFKELTRLKDEIAELKEKAVNAEIDVIRCIYNIDEPRYRAILIEKYINHRDIYTISVIYNQLGMQNNTTNYVKRTLRKAEKAFYLKNLQN